MKRKIPDTKAYEKIVGTFKKHKNGITLADVAAGTGLGLNQVKTLVPLAADEYCARLEVTESGEILYSFPRGFKSRYRGAGPALKKFLSSSGRFAVCMGILLFKAWIMVMLLGYFLLFIAIALASILLSVAASRNRRGGGGAHLFMVFFNMMIRLWFYSELLNAGRRGNSGWQQQRSAGDKKNPLHRAIFSFVFGDEDPNRDHGSLMRKEFISYLRKRRGVVSLPELMVLTGQNPENAESLITGLCAEFGGSPEVTEEGTIVYRFDEILLSGEKKNSTPTGAAFVSGPVAPLYKKPRVFSSNPGKMNFWFGIINSVNLLFGSYFMFNALSVGRIFSLEALQGAGLYGQVYYFLIMSGIDALPVIQIGLGLVPLLFSALFWLIPALRLWLLKKENDAIRLGNFRGFFYSRIWTSPEGFKPAGNEPRSEECRPRNFSSAGNLALKEMGRYSIPEVSVDEKQNEVFDFRELRREKDALEKYRASVEPKAQTGETVFDSA